MADQLPEDAAPSWQLSDRAVSLRVDAGGNKASQLSVILIEHPDGGVTGTGQVARDIEQAAQDALEVELGDEHPARVEQQTQAAIVE